MRTLIEIIESAKDGNKPTHDECYYSMLTLDGLWWFDRHVVIQLLEEKSARWLKMQSELSFRRAKTALNTSPVKWLGDNVPENPNQQRWRSTAKGLLKKVENSSKDGGLGND